MTAQAHGTPFCLRRLAACNDRWQALVPLKMVVRGDIIGHIMNICDSHLNSNGSEPLCVNHCLGIHRILCFAHRPLLRLVQLHKIISNFHAQTNMHGTLGFNEGLCSVRHAIVYIVLIATVRTRSAHASICTLQTPPRHPGTLWIIDRCVKAMPSSCDINLVVEASSFLMTKYASTVNRLCRRTSERDDL